jgi:hypothetical protein
MARRNRIVGRAKGGQAYADENALNDAPLPVEESPTAGTPRST